MKREVKRIANPFLSVERSIGSVVAVFVSKGFIFIVLLNLFRGIYIVTMIRFFALIDRRNDALD